MKTRKKVLIVFGTRPEAIKLAPLINELKSDLFFDVKVCVTAQHREMLDQVLALFNIKPDFDLDVMNKEPDLNGLISRMLRELKIIFDELQPELVIVHGDTATTLTASLAAYLNKIPVGHVEAGLRTNNIYSPWPEEGNRRLTASIASYHFAPTQLSSDNLLKENVDAKNIVITGNTVIDALLAIRDRINRDEKFRKEIKDNFKFLNDEKRLILVTAHRRESYGSGFVNICNAIKQIAKKRNDVQIVFPVHLNPNINDLVKRELSNIENVFLIEPQSYSYFIYLMMNSYMILTDSGGVQEEAPSLGVPVLVMRNTTEREEALNVGTVKLVGTNEEVIIREVVKLLDDKLIYENMSNKNNPYGDGKASVKIREKIKLSMF